MKKTFKLETIFIVLICGIIILYFYESIIFSKEITQNVSKTIYRIINIVFPSLFGFMVGCDFLIRTNLYKFLSTPLKPISRWIFKMPEDIFLVFLLSQIGGYPVGIRLINSLVENKQIDNKTAEKLVAFCYCPSPSFTAGIVGIGVFSNIKAGLAVYFSCMLANTITAFFLARIYDFKAEESNSKVNISSDNLVNSVVISGKNMLIISVIIVFFSYIITLSECMKLFEVIEYNNAKVIIKSLLETTSITDLAVEYLLLPIIAFVFSLGGFSIILQIVAINNKTTDLFYFFIFRIPVSFLSGIICFVILKNIPLDLQCGSDIILHNTSSNYSVLSSVCIFFMIITIFFHKKTSISQKCVL